MTDGTVVRSGKRLFTVFFLVAAFAISLAGQTITPEMQSKAESGDAAAQLALANAYLKRQSNDLAFKWFRAAADQANVEAQTQVAYLYSNGIGVAQDKSAAAEWYAKAAALGNANARYNLAVAYYNGEGIGLDDQQAYIWFALAKEAGDSQAINSITQIETEHDRVWVATARLRMAEMLENGRGVGADLASAARLYQDVADFIGEQEAATSKPQAELWSLAEARLGMMYFEGKGVSRNVGAAQTHCLASAKVHNSIGCACAAHIYLHPESGNPNYKEAARLYKEAADRGHPESMFRLAQMYESGQGLKQDNVQAYRNYYQAAAMGLEEAKLEMQRIAATMSEKEIKKAKSGLWLSLHN